MLRAVITKLIGKVLTIRVACAMCSDNVITITVMIQSFRTDRYGQTVQILIRLLLEEQLIRVFTVCYSICIILMKYPKVWSF